MGMTKPKQPASNRRFSWFLHIGTCYKRGYEAQQAGEPFESPYRTGSGVQQQRRGAWERGYKRAAQGLPLDDSNG
jgi:hypothetical protein